MNVGVARTCAIAVLISVAVCRFPAAVTAQKTPASGQVVDIESRRTQLLSLFDEEWQYELRSSPEMATSSGTTATTIVSRTVRLGLINPIWKRDASSSTASRR